MQSYAIIVQVVFYRKPVQDTYMGVVASSYVLHSGLNFTESYWFLLQEVSGLPNIYTQSLRATGTKTEGVHIMNVLIVTLTFGKHVV